MSHLSYEQRVTIQHYLEYNDHVYQKDIAQAIWVSPPTITHELARWKKHNIAYDASLAHERAKSVRAQANKNIHTKIQEDSLLAAFIREKIQLYRSPEQIGAVWTQSHWWTLSHNTIYRYCDTHHSWRRKKYARHKGKKRKNACLHTSKIPNRIDISQRPKIVDNKCRLGDFEWDTIVWDNKSDCIITLIDRVSLYWYATVVHLEKWENLSVVVSTFLSEILASIRKELRKTLTLDNGTEFADHEYITERTWTAVYFAQPYHSRERGCNENFNGLLRQFFPKGTSFKNITQKELDYYVQLINNRPRKKLWRKSPIDVFLP